LPGSKLTLINEGTGAQRTALSSARGRIVFSELVPATYSLTAEAPGFKRFERKGIVVGTQQQVAVEAKLELGQVSESVQVTESVPLVESTTASQGQVLDNKVLTELPNSDVIRSCYPSLRPMWCRLEIPPTTACKIRAARPPFPFPADRFAK